MDAFVDVVRSPALAQRLTSPCRAFARSKDEIESLRPNAMVTFRLAVMAPAAHAAKSSLAARG